MSLGVEPRRLGGRTGRHARLTGLLHDPAPWVILAALATWVVRMFHQQHCQQDVAGQPVKAMLRMCYSDIPIVWQTNQWGAGGPLLTDSAGIPQLPVITFLAAIGRGLTGLVRPLGGNGQAQLDAGNLFMVINAVLLFCLFLAWVIAHMLMGRDSVRAGDALGAKPRRSMDAMFLATSVGVMSAGLISWDLVAPALTGIALLLWSRGRVAVSGVVTGLALGAGIMPLALVVALGVLCARAGRMQHFGRHALWTGLTLAVVLIAAGTQSFAATRKAYLALLDPEAGYGSFWWILKEAGLAGQVVPTMSKLLIIAAAIGVGLLSLHAPRRPRVAQVAALVLISALMLAPTYSPQYVLWLVGLVALARPQLRDWLIFSGTQLLYFLAIWGHLQGNLRIGGGEDIGYPLAIVVHLTGLGWVASRILHDMFHPADDPGRGAVDDPQGGILREAPDAEWMTA